MIIMNKRIATLTTATVLVSSMTAYALFIDLENVTYGMTTGCNLSRDNVHQPVHLNSSNILSMYPAGNSFDMLCDNASGSSLSRGHWVCINGHPEVDTGASQRRYW